MQVLEGVRVIDSTQALAGPYCTMLLGDLGADVIKVERPGVGDMARGYGPPFLDGESVYFLSTNRNKRGVTLNYTSERGRKIMQQLLASADVFVVNIPKIESLKRFGLDYETLRGLNHRLVYCSITGYGASGPYAGRLGFDMVAQGESGLMSITGEPEGEPLRYPVAISDITTGVYSAMAILTALLARERTGRGQFLDMALLDSQVTWLTPLASMYFATGQRPRRLGNDHPTIVPYRPFRAKDKYIMLAVGTEEQWRRLCRVLEVEETVMTDPRFATNRDRNVNRDALSPQLAEIFSQRDADYWLGRLMAAEVPCGPINEVDEALGHPQLLARNMIVAIEHPALKQVMKSMGNPMHLSETPVSYRLAPPTLGQHNQEVLASLGYTQGEIQELVEDSVI